MPKYVWSLIDITVIGYFLNIWKCRRIFISNAAPLTYCSGNPKDRGSLSYRKSKAYSQLASVSNKIWLKPIDSLSVWHWERLQTYLIFYFCSVAIAWWKRISAIFKIFSDQIFKRFKMDRRRRFLSAEEAVDVKMQAVLTKRQKVFWRKWICRKRHSLYESKRKGSVTLNEARVKELYFFFQENNHR